MTETAPYPVRAIHRSAAESPATWAMGSLFEHLLTPAESGGTLAVSLVVQPPGLAPPLHRHTREDEVFYLLDGTIRYRAGEDVFDLAAGDLVFLPRGLPHAFRITGNTPARFLAMTTPGGLMGLYDEVGVPASQRRLPGADGQTLEVEIPKWNQVSPRYGLEVVGPPLPE